jgi:hypothetical protein
MNFLSSSNRIANDQDNFASQTALLDQRLRLPLTAAAVWQSELKRHRVRPR